MSIKHRIERLEKSNKVSGYISINALLDPFKDNINFCNTLRAKLKEFCTLSEVLEALPTDFRSEVLINLQNMIN